MDKKTKIAFVGDSLTEWGYFSQFFPEFEVFNFGIAGEKTYQIFNRLNSVNEAIVDKIFVMAGINDLGDGRAINDIFADYKQIVENLIKNSPQADIFIQSLLPINTELFFNPRLYVEQIPMLNERLQQLAQEYACTYIDLFPHFCNKKQQLLEEFTHDGLHLTEEAYLIWENNLNSYIYN